MPPAPSLAPLIDRVRAGRSPAELVYAAHPAWPHPRTPHPARRTLRVAVLDASFNPPSRAHLALALAPRPAAPGYDAALLLLSVRNADKQPAPGDATPVQRLEMLLLLAQDAARALPHGNVAVALIDAPTFVRKSAVLLSYLRQRLATPPAALSPPACIPAPPAPPSPVPGDALRPQLTFLVGTDTLERLLAPRFYPSPDAMRAALRRFFAGPPDGDDARVVCARRALPSAADAQAEAEAALIAAARECAEEGRVRLVDIPEELRAVSSTRIRQGVESGDEAWKELVTPAIADYIVQHDLYRA